MKTLSFILSVYLLLLAFYPCTDNETCADEKKEGITIATTAGHDHHESEEDHCSPLCICSCCAAIFQVSKNTIDIPVHIDHNTILVTPYIQGKLADSNFAIWQPPRLS